MSSSSDFPFEPDDQNYLGLRFFDLLHAKNVGDDERVSQCIDELRAWGISIEIAGPDTHRQPAA
jgi:hypothetical protein